MDCPRCKKPLIILELEQVEVDYCGACQVVWLDSGELELLIDSPGDTRIALLPVQDATERSLKCPKCRKRMEKVRGGAENGILLDRCKNGHGIWFDGGELGALLKGEKSSPHNRISEYLRGIFMKKAKSIDRGEST
jgi:Zn-finger nucleic acid-binding protein